MAAPKQSSEIVARRSLGFARRFLEQEAASGLLLMAAVAAAILVANSGLRPLYEAVLSMVGELRVGAFLISMPLLLWINDALMAIFFLLVGLEIKREILEGELSSVRQLALPGLGALGGMAVPAVFYTLVNLVDRHGPVGVAPAVDALRGWAIPAATDIAFAIGALSLAGGGVPASLRIFLLALAILDDLGAILIIACFYSGELAPWALAATGLGILLLFLLNRSGVQRIQLYLVVGALTWFAMLRSGVHPTLAGVAVAFAIPIRPSNHAHGSPLKHLERSLHGWVAYGIVPLFGFANAGLVFGNVGWRTFGHGIPLGILAGLALGKPIGVFSAAYLATRLKLATWPAGARTIQLFGAAVLCGIGFTMSLFIGQLAFADEVLRTETRLGVFTGSLAAGLAGFLILRFSGQATGRPAQKRISAKASTSTDTPHGSEPTPIALRA